MQPHGKQTHGKQTHGKKTQFFLRAHGLPTGGSRVVPQVDCWVYVDDFAASGRRCLRAFEAQGGRVNWESDAIKRYLRAPDDRERPACSGHNETARVWGEGKNEPGGHQCGSGSPENCNKYFSGNQAALATLAEKMDAPLYEAFGWAACCNSTHVHRAHQQGHFARERFCAPMQD